MTLESTQKVVFVEVQSPPGHETRYHPACNSENWGHMQLEEEAFLGVVLFRERKRGGIESRKDELPCL